MPFQVSNIYDQPHQLRDLAQVLAEYARRAQLSYSAQIVEGAGIAPALRSTFSHSELGDIVLDLNLGPQAAGAEYSRSRYTTPGAHANVAGRSLLASIGSSYLMLGSEIHEHGGEAYFYDPIEALMNRIDASFQLSRMEREQLTTAQGGVWKNQPQQVFMKSVTQGIYRAPGGLQWIDATQSQRQVSVWAQQAAVLLNSQDNRISAAQRLSGQIFAGQVRPGLDNTDPDARVRALAGYTLQTQEGSEYLRAWSPQSFGVTPLGQPQFSQVGYAQEALLDYKPEALMKRRSMLSRETAVPYWGRSEIIGGTVEPYVMTPTEIRPGLAGMDVSRRQLLTRTTYSPEGTPEQMLRSRVAWVNPGMTLRGEQAPQPGLLVNRAIPQSGLMLTPGAQVWNPLATFEPERYLAESVESHPLDVGAELVGEYYEEGGQVRVGALLQARDWRNDPANRGKFTPDGLLRPGESVTIAERWDPNLRDPSLGRLVRAGERVLGGWRPIQVTAGARPRLISDVILNLAPSRPYRPPAGLPPGDPLAVGESYQPSEEDLAIEQTLRDAGWTNIAWRGVTHAVASGGERPATPIVSAVMVVGGQRVGISFKSYGPKGGVAGWGVNEILTAGGPFHVDLLTESKNFGLEAINSLMAQPKDRRLAMLDEFLDSLPLSAEQRNAVARVYRYQDRLHLPDLQEALAGQTGNEKWLSEGYFGDHLADFILANSDDPDFIKRYGTGIYEGEMSLGLFRRAEFEATLRYARAGAALQGLNPDEAEARLQQMLRPEGGWGEDAAWRSKDYFEVRQYDRWFFGPALQRPSPEWNWKTPLVGYDVMSSLQSSGYSGFAAQIGLDLAYSSPADPIRRAWKQVADVYQRARGRMSGGEGAIVLSPTEAEVLLKGMQFEAGEVPGLMGGQITDAGRQMERFKELLRQMAKDHPEWDLENGVLQISGASENNRFQGLMENPWTMSAISFKGRPGTIVEGAQTVGSYIERLKKLLRASFEPTQANMRLAQQAADAQQAWRGEKFGSKTDLMRSLYGKEVPGAIGGRYMVTELLQPNEVLVGDEELMRIAKAAGYRPSELEQFKEEIARKQALPGGGSYTGLAAAFVRYPTLHRGPDAPGSAVPVRIITEQMLRERLSKSGVADLAPHDLGDTVLISKWLSGLMVGDSDYDPYMVLPLLSATTNDQGQRVLRKEIDDEQFVRDLIDWHDDDKAWSAFERTLAKFREGMTEDDYRATHGFNVLSSQYGEVLENYNRERPARDRLGLFKPRTVESSLGQVLSAVRQHFDVRAVGMGTAFNLYTRGMEAAMSGLMLRGVGGYTMTDINRLVNLGATQYQPNLDALNQRRSAFEHIVSSATLSLEEGRAKMVWLPGPYQRGAWTGGWREGMNMEMAQLAYLAGRDRWMSDEMAARLLVSNPNELIYELDEEGRHQPISRLDKFKREFGKARQLDDVNFMKRMIELSTGDNSLIGMTSPLGTMIWASALTRAASSGQLAELAQHQVVFGDLEMTLEQLYKFLTPVRTFYQTLTLDGLPDTHDLVETIGLARRHGLDKLNLGLFTSGPWAELMDEAGRGSPEAAAANFAEIERQMAAEQLRKVTEGPYMLRASALGNLLHGTGSFFSDTQAQMVLLNLLSPHEAAQFEISGTDRRVTAANAASGGSNLGQLKAGTLAEDVVVRYAQRDQGAAGQALRALLGEKAIFTNRIQTAAGSDLSSMVYQHEGQDYTILTPKPDVLSIKDGKLMITDIKHSASSAEELRQLYRYQLAVYRDLLADPARLRQFVNAYAAGSDELVDIEAYVTAAQAGIELQLLHLDKDKVANQEYNVLYESDQGAFEKRVLADVEAGILNQQFKAVGMSDVAPAFDQMGGIVARAAQRTFGLANLPSIYSVLQRALKATASPAGYMGFRYTGIDAGSMHSHLYRLSSQIYNAAQQANRAVAPAAASANPYTPFSAEQKAYMERKRLMSASARVAPMGFANPQDDDEARRRVQQAAEEHGPEEAANVAGEIIERHNEANQQAADLLGGPGSTTPSSPREGDPFVLGAGFILPPKPTAPQPTPTTPAAAPAPGSNSGRPPGVDKSNYLRQEGLPSLAIANEAMRQLAAFQPQIERTWRAFFGSVRSQVPDLFTEEEWGKVSWDDVANRLINLDVGLYHQVVAQAAGAAGMEHIGLGSAIYQEIKKAQFGLLRVAEGTPLLAEAQDIAARGQQTVLGAQVMGLMSAERSLRISGANDRARSLMADQLMTQYQANKGRIDQLSSELLEGMGLERWSDYEKEVHEPLLHQGLQRLADDPVKAATMRQLGQLAKHSLILASRFSEQDLDIGPINEIGSRVNAKELMRALGIDEKLAAAPRIEGMDEEALAAWTKRLTDAMQRTVEATDKYTEALKSGRESAIELADSNLKAAKANEEAIKLEPQIVQARQRFTELQALRKAGVTVSDISLLAAESELKDLEHQQSILTASGQPGRFNWSKFGRSVFGGFGMFYMERLKGLATESFGRGYEESQGQFAITATIGALAGGQVNPLFNAMIARQQAEARAGGSLASWWARSTSGLTASAPFMDLGGSLMGGAGIGLLTTYLGHGIEAAAVPGSAMAAVGTSLTAAAPLVAGVVAGGLVLSSLASYGAQPEQSQLRLSGTIAHSLGALSEGRLPLGDMLSIGWMSLGTIAFGGAEGMRAVDQATKLAHYVHDTRRGGFNLNQLSGMLGTSNADALSQAVYTLYNTPMFEGRFGYEQFVPVAAMGYIAGAAPHQIFNVLSAQQGGVDVFGMAQALGDSRRFGTPTPSQMFRWANFYSDFSADQSARLTAGAQLAQILPRTPYSEDMLNRLVPQDQLDQTALFHLKYEQLPPSNPIINWFTSLVTPGYGTINRNWFAAPDKERRWAPSDISPDELAQNIYHMQLEELKRPERFGAYAEDWLGLVRQAEYYGRYVDLEDQLRTAEQALQGQPGYDPRLFARVTAELRGRIQLGAQSEQVRDQLSMMGLDPGLRDTLPKILSGQWSAGQLQTMVSYGMQPSQELLDLLEGIYANPFQRQMFSGMLQGNRFAWSQAVATYGMGTLIGALPTYIGGINVADMLMMGTSLRPSDTSQAPGQAYTGGFIASGAAPFTNYMSPFQASQIWGSNWASTDPTAGQVYGGAAGIRAAAVTGIQIPGTQTTVYGVRAMQVWQAEQQYAAQMAQVGNQLAQLRLSYAFNTGIGLDAYSTTDPRTGESLIGGRGFWALEDASRALSNRQQEWGFDYQRSQLAMQSQHFYESNQLARQGQLAQRGWAMQDWAYQDQLREMQWGWKQEDFQEEVRFLTGRDRRIAERQMARETILHDLEGEQIEKNRARQQEVWRQEDQRFRLTLQHFEEQKRRQEEQIRLSEQFYQERKKLEEEQQRLQRAYFLENHKLQQQAAGAFAKSMKDAHDNLLAVQEAQARVADQWELLFGNMDSWIESVLKILGNQLSDKDREGLNKGQGPGAQRAGGGPVDVGITYRVNDQRLAGAFEQEYFTPLVPGTVTPAHKVDPWSNGNLLLQDSLASSRANRGLAQPIIIYIGNEHLGSFVVEAVDRKLRV